ncbi:MAG: hypothetical protein ACRDHD_09385, partial [Candidatus Limnocylindria bacterium]
MPELMPRELLEVTAQGITAVLATWLGLTVLVRSPASPAARAFSLLTLFLVTWSVAIIVQRFAEAAVVDRVANGFEEMAAFLVIAATPNVAIAISAEGLWTRLQRLTVFGSYGLAVLMGLPAVVNPDAKFAITPPHFEVSGIPGEVFGWAWIVVRMLIFASALAWIILALRHAGNDVARQRQLKVALLTVGLGAAGGIARFTPPLSDTDRWLGVSLITLSVVVATYAVFAQRIFFSADVAARTFRYSVVTAFAVTAYVGILVGGDRVVRNLLGIELPLVTAIGLVATVALFEPVANLVRRRVLGQQGREASYQRLLRALGESVFTAQRPTTSIEPALARLSRTFRSAGAHATDSAGSR